MSNTAYLCKLLGGHAPPPYSYGPDLTSFYRAYISGASQCFWRREKSCQIYKFPSCFFRVLIFFSWSRLVLQKAIHYRKWPVCRRPEQTSQLKYLNILAKRTLSVLLLCKQQQHEPCSLVYNWLKLYAHHKGKSLMNIQASSSNKRV